MRKLRLNPDDLSVASFEAATPEQGKGTVDGHAGTECSKQYTCGIASRGPEVYQQVPLTRYACCI